MTTDEMIQLEHTINERFGSTSLDWRIGKYEDFRATKWWWHCNGQAGYADSIAEALQQMASL